MTTRQLAKCCKCVNNATARHEKKYYCEIHLLDKLGITTAPIDVYGYYVDGDNYIGNDWEHTLAEVIDDYCERIKPQTGKITLDSLGFEIGTEEEERIKDKFDELAALVRSAKTYKEKAAILKILGVLKGEE